MLSRICQGPMPWNMPSGMRSGMKAGGRRRAVVVAKSESREGGWCTYLEGGMFHVLPHVTRYVLCPVHPPIQGAPHKLPPLLCIYKHR